MSTGLKTSLKRREDGAITLEIKKMEEEIVILPFSRYEALLEQIEDLKDIQDNYKAMEEYRMGKGRPFREFLAECGGEFDL